MQKLIGISLAVLATIMLAGSVFAISVPATSPIVHINYVVNNDEDARANGGYWALDSYSKTITIWDLGPAVNGNSGTHDYKVNAMYSGTFCTYGGALSPIAGTVEPNDGCGTMTASYDAVINGTNILIGTTSQNPASGSLGTINFGGTKADVLKGLSGTGDTDGYSWLGNYFPSYANFCYVSCSGASSMIDWTWTYSLPNGASGGTKQVFSGVGAPFNGGQEYSLNTGDIITTSSSPLAAATVECNSNTDCPAQNACVNQACVPQVCGLTATGGIQFGSVIQGSTTQSADTTTVTNTGNVQITPSIFGDYWYGSQYPGSPNNYMPIESTAWTSNGGSNWYSLSSTPASIVTPLSPFGGIATVYYQLTVPAKQPTDSYTQQITYSAGC